MRVKFDLSTAQVSENKSKQFSNELARNVYFGISKTAEKVGIHDFPGLTLLSSGTGIDRGDHVFNGERYVLNGNTLYHEDSVGTRTALTGLIAGSSRAVFANDGNYIYFVVDGVIYRTAGTNISVVTQSVISSPASIAYINKQFIITGDNGLFAMSDVGDGITYQSINTAEEETKPDPIIRAYVFNQLIYMLGSESAVPYYNTGEGNPPIQRQETGLVNIGIAGTHAVTNTKKYLYWLSNDNEIVKCVGAGFELVQTEGVAEVINNLNVTSDAIFSTYVLNGISFVLIKFPTEGVSLLYNETYNTFTELSSGTNKNAIENWYGNAISKCYGKYLTTDPSNGNTYILDRDNYTDNGDPRLRIIVPRMFTGKDIGVMGNCITATQARIECQKGVGLSAGQGSDPVLMCGFSAEGGEVWGSEEFVSIGELGDYTKLVDFWGEATGYEIKLRIMISDPVYFSCYGGWVDLIDGGY